MKKMILPAVLIGTLFCFAGWGVNAQLQRSGSTARQQWEYKSIAVGGSYWEEDGRQAQGNPLGDLRPKFRQLGIEGWEMIAISDFTPAREDQTALTTYWFKRPK